ncbi:hypothetical protein CAPTEDRAFT_186452 [Capitella teleta]|uniref:Uncharacterized protein n=1 Tax=Capitella teleta TaxID=283909 RepID=R7U6P4_CAPTE|nr:hypothetical protein CAPTEDRAFT_186452 [Capitella teleta]|eukprot:ELU02030.1 hypothetical protein CAPTEDRAFT_186452 [Capitella teleta]
MATGACDNQWCSGHGTCVNSADSKAGCLCDTQWTVAENIYKPGNLEKFTCMSCKKQNASLRGYRLRIGADCSQPKSTPIPTSARQRLLEEPFWIGIIVVLCVIAITGISVFIRKKCFKHFQCDCCDVLCCLCMKKCCKEDSDGPDIKKKDDTRHQDSLRTPSPGPSTRVDGFENPGFSVWSTTPETRHNLRVPGNQVTVNMEDDSSLQSGATTPNMSPAIQKQSFQSLRFEKGYTAAPFRPAMSISADTLTVPTAPTIMLDNSSDDMGIFGIVGGQVALTKEGTESIPGKSVFSVNRAPSMMDPQRRRSLMMQRSSTLNAPPTDSSRTTANDFGNQIHKTSSYETLCSEVRPANPPTLEELKIQYLTSRVSRDKTRSSKKDKSTKDSSHSGSSRVKGSSAQRRKDFVDSVLKARHMSQTQFSSCSTQASCSSECSQSYSQDLLTMRRMPKKSDDCYKSLSLDGIKRRRLSHKKSHHESRKTQRRTSELPSILPLTTREGASSRGSNSSSNSNYHRNHRNRSHSRTSQSSTGSYHYHHYHHHHLGQLPPSHHLASTQQKGYYSENMLSQSFDAVCSDCPVYRSESLASICSPSGHRQRSSKKTHRRRDKSRHRSSSRQSRKPTNSPESHAAKSPWKSASLKDFDTDLWKPDSKHAKWISIDRSTRRSDNRSNKKHSPIAEKSLSKEESLSSPYHQTENISAINTRDFLRVPSSTEYSQSSISPGESISPSGVSPSRSDYLSSSGISCDYHNSVNQDTFDSDHCQHFTTHPLTLAERDTLTKLNSMSDAKMSESLLMLAQQHAENEKTHNCSSVSSDEGVKPMGALPPYFFSSNTKHPLRDSAYQSKEQSTEQYSSSKVGSTTVSPKQTGEVADNIVKCKKDRPPLRREDNKVIDQLEQAAIKLASLSHSEEADPEDVYVQTFHDVIIEDPKFQEELIPMERLDQPSISGTVSFLFHNASSLFNPNQRHAFRSRELSIIADEGEHEPTDSPPDLNHYINTSNRPRLDASRWKAEDPIEMLELPPACPFLDHYDSADQSCVYSDILFDESLKDSLRVTESSSNDHSASDRSEIYVVGDRARHVSIDSSTDNDSFTEYTWLIAQCIECIAYAQCLIGIEQPGKVSMGTHHLTLFISVLFP